MTTYGERLNKIHQDIDDEECPPNLFRKLVAEKREIIRRYNLSTHDPWSLSLSDEMLEITERNE